MLLKLISSISLLASLATAHFDIEYPEMRGDSFAPGASQWIYPCAGVNQTASTNRTIWPLTGGSIDLHLHHPWTYVFINLGFGTDYPSFNMTLTQQLLNVTGNGTLCLPQVILPAGINPVDGQNATLQVVTSGMSGSALYNCADVTFSSTATILNSSVCSNSSNVVASIVTPNGTTTSTAANASSTTSGAVGSYFGSISIAGFTAVMGAVAVSLLL